MGPGIGTGKRFGEAGIIAEARIIAGLAENEGELDSPLDKGIMAGANECRCHALPAMLRPHGERRKRGCGHGDAIRFGHHRTEQDMPDQYAFPPCTQAGHRIAIVMQPPHKVRLAMMAMGRRCKRIEMECADPVQIAWGCGANVHLVRKALYPAHLQLSCR